MGKNNSLLCFVPCERNERMGGSCFNASTLLQLLQNSTEVHGYWKMGLLLHDNLEIIKCANGMRSNLQFKDFQFNLCWFGYFVQFKSFINTQAFERMLTLVITVKDFLCLIVIFQAEISFQSICIMTTRNNRAKRAELILLLIFGLKSIGGE